jgi:hypothetical protein
VRTSRRFASGTSVPADRTRNEIEAALTRYGADGFLYASRTGKARIEFFAHEKRIRFDLPMPTEGDIQREDKRAAETRRLWRCLLLSVKAKLEAVESGISVFEDEFLAHIVMPNGHTVGETALPAIEQAYASGKPVGLLGPGI